MSPPGPPHASILKRSRRPSAAGICDTLVRLAEAADRPSAAVTAAVTAAARAHPRGARLEELPASDDDADGRSRGNTQVLEQMNQEDHVTTSFWGVAARPWSSSFAVIREQIVSLPG
jgi:hypothetical protein